MNTREIDILRHAQYLFNTLMNSPLVTVHPEDYLAGLHREIVSRVTAMFNDLPPTVQPLVDDFGLLHLLPRVLPGFLQKEFEKMQMQARTVSFNRMIEEDTRLNREE